jgi:signal transduction histidine kinase
MTAGALRAGSLRVRLTLLFGGPLIVALAALPWTLGVAPSDVARELDRKERRLRETFAGLIEEVRTLAELALADSPETARDAALARSGRLGRRVEGVGLLGPDRTLDAWVGMPADPPAWFADPARSPWHVVIDGVRTRLFARAGPDERGRIAVVSFVIDSTLDDLRFAELLPDDLRRDVEVVVSFGAPTTPAPAGARPVTLRAGSDEVLAAACLVPASAEGRARRARQVVRAWAAALFVVLLGGLFDWRARAASGSGLAIVALAIGLARAVLTWQNVTGRLLPRDLGSPSVYGSSQLWGLVESPADLLLTGAALWLFAVALRARCLRPDLRPWVARLAAAAGAAGATLAIAGIAASLARNSRVPLLERPAPFELDARLALWLGLLLPILGAAELWSAAWLRTRRNAANAPSLLPLAFGVAALCAASSLALQWRTERLATERLRSEYAPQVLQQEALRRAALETAMREIVEDYDPLRGGRPDYLAYEAWVGGALFHGRFKSSLDFFDAQGEPLSHFGFGLPALDESPDPARARGSEPPIEHEWIDSGAAAPRLLHAEVPIVRDGAVAAVVIGHVLDEPDNLPFLPWSQTYLAALGPVIPRSVPAELHYVLYEERVGVRLSTLLQPPAETADLRRAAADGSEVHVRAGNEPYLALALADDLGRLHLMLLPRSGLAERLGAAVRLALLGLLLLAGIEILDRSFRPAALRELLAFLRRSFYRKLLAALLAASIVPLVGLALFLRGYLERRGDAALVASATQLVSAAQRVVEDYSSGPEEEGAELTDEILHWLHRIVGQEIHVYRGADGALQASSAGELFDSGLLPPRLDGDVRRRLVEGGLPHVVAPMAIGSRDVPVAYAPARGNGDPRGLVVAVPLVLEERQIARGVSSVAEMILLATVALVGLLAVAAATLARTVARPVRDLVEATSRIAAGDYRTRLVPHTRDEVAQLVHGFNAMAEALGRQHADLERRRDYIETLLRHATTAVVSLDAAGRVVTLNPAANALVGAARLEVGADFGRVLAGARTFEPLARALGEARSGVPVDADLAGDSPRRLRAVRVELRRADGERFGTLILLEDVTELMRSNQLAAWAEMARAIAHEIKNPLTPIQLSAEHLARLLADRDPGPTAQERACVETIKKQVRALHEIAGEFSAYAKLPLLAPRAIDPVAFMRELVAPYRAAQPPGIEIRERYASAPAIAADPKVLARAVVNLIENALQAMPDGGRLTLAVEGGGPGRPVELSVSDTGPGLDPAVRRRLFEPYFSTKSSGTGLGLAITRRAVEAHGGTIEVTDEPGPGTTFRIRVPAT